jgi:hypothetical protein
MSWSAWALSRLIVRTIRARRARRQLDADLLWPQDVLIDDGFHDF